MITVVVPSNREGCLAQFLHEWEDDFKDAHVIVVEDNPERTFKVPDHITHVSWSEIDADLKANAWIIPRRTSAIRSYGTFLACCENTDIIWHLDDDCYPEAGRQGSYLTLLEEVFGSTWEDDRWWNTIHDSGFYPRGYPYGARGTLLPTMVHHGLWSNMPDLDGMTQLRHPEFRMPPCYLTEKVPYGKFFPMCGMNLAFRRKAAPLMYMGLQGKDYPFDRFDDMWCGLFVKLTADHLGWGITSGAPGIHHSRASDAARNATAEAPGILAHERLWQEAAEVSLTGCETPAACYRKFADMIRARAPAQGEDSAYWNKLSRAMYRWIGLYE